MQTTLLGLAIAFILALIAALVGPYFIDWNQFRPQFEAEASRVIGVPVHVGGELDALLLPTPTLRLRSLSIGGDNGPARVRADRLNVEFNLGALMRGEWRASELTLDGFSLDLGLDRQGRFEWPASADRFNLGAVAIDRLNLGGRMTLRDAASNATLQLDNLRFSGDVRALAGAMRGDGSFTLLGARTPFRISTGQTGDGKGSRLRLVLEPGERPLSADLDGIMTFDGSVPRFEGGLTLARPAEANSRGLPWRMTSRLKASPTSAAFEQLETTYGPDDNALRLTGAGDARFGASPLLRMNLSARQLDADRLLGKGGSEAEPLQMLPALRALVTALPASPLPVQLEASADQIALGGKPVQNLAIELKGDARSWSLGRLEMRAPGATRVSASGSIAPPGPSARFSGPVTIESTDPDAFAAWLQGRSEVMWHSQKPLRLRGEAVVTGRRIGLEGLNAEVNGTAMGGRLAFLTAADGKSRFEAALKAETFDLDAMSSLFALLTGPQAALPDEAQISLASDRLVLAGHEMRPAAVDFSYGPKTISLDGLQIGDSRNGVSISGAGAFDRDNGGGKLTLAASGPSLAQIGAVIAPVAPLVADRLDALPKMPGAAHMQVSVAADRQDRGDRVDGRAVLDIDAPQVKGSVTLTATPALASVHGIDIVALKSSPFGIDTKLTSDKTSALVTLLGLDRVIAAQDGAAQFEASIAGTWGTPLQLKARLAGAGIDGDIQGTGDLSADQPKASLNLSVRKADVAALFGSASASLPLNVALSSRLGVAGNAFTFDDLDSSIGGSRLRGHVAFTRGDEIGVDGEIGLDMLDVAPVTAFAFGAAGRGASEPLGQGWLRNWRGRLAFQALRASLPGGSELRPLSGVIKGDGQSLALDNVKGGIGGGEVGINLDARQAGQGASFNARVQVSDADGAALRYRSLAMPDGRVSLQMSLTGQGRSISGLAGALSGGGTLSLQDARIAGLDPRAFEVAVRAGDAGQPTDDLKLKELVDPVLAAGGLTVPSAQIPFSIRDGRLRVETTTLEAARARVAVAGGYDLPADQADIRAVMTPVTTRPISGRPEIRVDLNGSPDRLARTVDVAALSSWLAMRAIDRETRRLDQLERGVTLAPESSDLWDEPLPQVEPLSPGEVKVPARDPRRKNSGTKAPAPRPAVPPQASKAAPQAPAAPTGSASAPPLPPPIDIRPAPGILHAPKQRPATAPSASGGAF